MQGRWPKSLDSQEEAVLHQIRAIGRSKAEDPDGIRSLTTWNIYREEIHRFAAFLATHGCLSLLDAPVVASGMEKYLQERLVTLNHGHRSLQTMERTLAALSKLEYAVNHYLDRQGSDAPRLDTMDLRRGCKRASKKWLPYSSAPYDARAYPRPEELVRAMPDETYRLQAMLQLEGGLRAEGVGAPRSARLKNPLTPRALGGDCADPVTGEPAGVVIVKEKGGKVTRHFVSAATYAALVSYLQRHGQLQSDYPYYVEAINRAARATGQYARGRGSHGLKHSFARRRYLECADHGWSHERALQQVSLETAHFRMKETLTYTRPRR